MCDCSYVCCCVCLFVGMFVNLCWLFVCVHVVCVFVWLRVCLFVRSFERLFGCVFQRCYMCVFSLFVCHCVFVCWCGCVRAFDSFVCLND